jgi:hypothetical protein
MGRKAKSHGGYFLKYSKMRDAHFYKQLVIKWFYIFTKSIVYFFWWISLKIRRLDIQSNTSIYL